MSVLNPIPPDEIRKRYGAFVEFASRIWGIPEETIYGVIKTESAGDPNARGSTGDYGLMQITREGFDIVMSRYVLNYKFPDDMFNPEKNIRVGTALLRINLDDTGSLDKAIQMYNTGKVGTEKGLAYLDKVTKNTQFFLT